MVVVPQPIFVRSLGVNLRCCLPDALLERTYPVRAMLDAGLIVALSSDAPMTREDDPLLGIQAAVLRRDEEGKPIAGGQALSVAEALRAYTMGGALASGDADNRGSLRAGKRADLAVLSANPLEVEPEALDELRVDMTYVDGELAYER